MLQMEENLMRIICVGKGMSVHVPIFCEKQWMCRIA